MPVSVRPLNLSVPTYNRVGTAANPVTSQSLSVAGSVPGVSATGIRGSVVNTPARISTSGSVGTSPLQAYQEKLRERAQQGQRFTDSLVQNRQVQTRTGFNQKYNVAARAPIATSGRRPNQPTATIPSSNFSGFKPQGQTGRLDPNTLTRSVGGALLISSAAARLNALNAAFRQEFGTDIGVTDSYRSYAQQVATKRAKGNLAATPGTSVHGSARALDLGTGVNKRGSAQYNWMMQNAPKFGWVNPRWAQTSKIEPWHWEFVG